LDSDSGASSTPPRPSWMHWLLLISVLLLVAAVVLPPLFNISRYKRQIAASISRSIGRPVHLSTVRLHLLPRPGFEISEFEVEEDPAFGNEPSLHSASVIASIRLSSLWRGRLEIARISLDEPSLNLVRDAQGHWNFDSILMKASQSAIAPTDQTRPGAAPRFPYIVATNARINFKQGNEKMAFSFLNADVSVWLDKPEEWRLRFEAQPVRTDLDLALADTGIVRVEGTIYRAAQLRQVPIVLHAEWTKAPLGQLGRLLIAHDLGWRGDLDVRADITGTPADARFKTRFRANDLHRLEFTPLDPLDMDASCQGRYLGSSSSIEDLQCTSPIGNGRLMLSGMIHAVKGDPQPDVQIHMEKVPAAALLETLRSVRNDFAPDLRVRGAIDGDFHFGPQEGFSNAILDGAATMSALEVSSKDMEKPLLIPLVKLATKTGKPGNAAPVEKHPGRKAKSAPIASEAAEPALLLEPFVVDAESAHPLTADGRFTASHFSIHLAGAAQIKEMTAIGKSFGAFPSVMEKFAPQGTAEIDLTLRGPWLMPVADVDHPQPVDAAEGTLEIRKARLTARFLPLPVDISSARASFSGSVVTWDPVDFLYGDLHGEAAVHHQFPCINQKGCNVHFDLRFASLDAAATETALLGAGGGGGTFKDLLGQLKGNPPPWPPMTGTVTAGTLTLDQMTIHDARVSIAVEGNHVQIDSLDGRVFGGSLHAGGAMDFTGNPHYALDADLTKANPAEIAAVFHEKWGSGQINLTTHLDLVGFSTVDLAASAKGTFHWDWSRGSVASEPASPLARFDRWQGDGSVANKSLSLDHSALARSGPPSTVTGSISFDRELKLTIDEGGSASTVTGTLQKPLSESSQAVVPLKASAPIKRSMRTSP
jgi:AsmA family